MQFAFGGLVLFTVDAGLRSPRPTVHVVVPDGVPRDAAIDRAVLVAEARARGLDRDDVIVRRRLEQKMRFALEGAASPATDAAALRRFRDEHADRYRRDERLDFVHVFVDAGRHDDAEAVADRWRAELAAGRDVAGDAFVHGRHARAVEPELVAARFGETFAAGLASIELGEWTTLESTYGWHVVRIDARRRGGLPAVDELRGQLEADVRAAARAEALELGLVELRARYDVRVGQEDG